MAKKFAGFKPETMTNKILPALGYDGPMDQKSINAFLAASPAAASKMGKYTMAARQMVEGKPVGANKGNFFNYRTGTYKPLHKIDPSQRGLAAMERAGKDIFGRDASPRTRSGGGVAQPAGPVVYGPDGKRYPNPIAAQQAGVTNYTTTPPVKNPDGSIVTPLPGGGTSTTYTGPTGTQMPSGSLLSKQIGEDPTKMVTRAGVVAADGGPAALVPQGTGQAGPAAQALAGVVGQTATAEEIAAMSPAQYQAYESQQALQAALSNYLAAQGQLDPNSLVDPAQMNPFAAAALQLQAAQLGQAQTVDAPDPLEVSPDQLISGSAVDQGRVDSTIAKNEAASVKTELDTLMQDFQGGNPPSWAAGAMRNAAAAMAARGLSASSMAGMAIVQAGMEAALPIAQIDASNKQEVALLNAEQRATFLGMEFDQEFQTRVRNAARISEIANINFTAQQQIALENAKMAQTVDLANLDARQAKVLADAATLSQIDLANLNNRQQANIQNAKSFLQMDLANLTNEQQMQVLKAQETSQSILSDAAAINAAKQFNATSENQTNQFFAGLGSQVQRFNAEQINAINRFNAGEVNAISQFNAAQTNARDQFNAQNHLIVAQANAAWAQAITTAANAAANQANRDAALVANNLTSTMYNNAIQRERDLLAWAWQSGESERDRITKIAEAQIDASGQSETLLETAAGGFIGELVTGAAAYIIGKYLPFKK
tara:strand:- start:2743 stop:4887 length:2145 start_codon:yes stop_codon:yes gene_type:complete